MTKKISWSGAHHPSSIALFFIVLESTRGRQRERGGAVAAFTGSPHRWPRSPAFLATICCRLSPKLLPRLQLRFHSHLPISVVAKAARFLEKTAARRRAAEADPADICCLGRLPMCQRLAAQPSTQSTETWHPKDVMRRATARERGSNDAAVLLRGHRMGIALPVRWRSPICHDRILPSALRPLPASPELPSLPPRFILCRLLPMLGLDKAPDDKTKSQKHKRSTLEDPPAQAKQIKAQPPGRTLP